MPGAAPRFILSTDPGSITAPRPQRTSDDGCLDASTLTRGNHHDPRRRSQASCSPQAQPSSCRAAASPHARHTSFPTTFRQGLTMTTEINKQTSTSKSASPQIYPTSSGSPPPPSRPSATTGPPRKPRRLLCLKEVSYRVGVARATVYRMVWRARECQEPSFPLPVQIAPGRIGWHEHEIDAWIEGRPRA